MEESREQLEEEYRELLLQREKLLQRELYKTNLFELCKLIGFNDLGECHVDLCNDLISTENKYNRRLFMYPRSHFKTSVITIANTVRRILNNPDVRILIASSTLENAKKSLMVIKNVFWQNEKFRAIFPEFCPKEGAKDFGTQTNFIVPNRKKVELKDGTVECAGDGQTITGRHFDIIVFTDICTPENTQSKLQLESTKAWVKYCVSILDNAIKDKIDMEGTRYDHDDVYGEWIDMAKKSKNFFVKIKPALYMDGAVEKSLFHERYSVEDIRQIETEQGSFIFSGQYQLDPVDATTAAFKRDCLRYIQRVDIPRTKDMKFKYPIYMTIDPAISESEKADNSVITIGTVDNNNILYIIDILFGHWNTTVLLNKIWDAYFQYRPRIIGIETVSFQKMLARAVQEMGHQKGVILPVKGITRNTSQSKVMRIMALVPRFEQKKIFFSDSLDKAFIETQILRFNPEKKNNKDDLLDTLADMDEIKLIPQELERNEYLRNPEKRFLDWLKKTPEEREDMEEFEVMEVEDEY